jgi:hypothetical protein
MKYEETAAIYPNATKQDPREIPVTPAPPV